jgi:flavin reductase (DIM6/NTAB) family NADH-FMN oxidoreductase RutF
MFYQPQLRNHGLPHDPFKALIAPRPIGWISTRATDGRVNLAPYSYFNALCDDPWLVAFASDGEKDSMTFAKDSGEFALNIVTAEFLDAMVASSVNAPRGSSEFDFAGLDTEPCELIAAPRVKGIKAAMECKVTEILQPKLLSGGASGVHMVIGEVIGIYIDPSILTDGLVDYNRARLLSRLGYLDYGLIGETVPRRRPKWPVT